MVDLWFVLSVYISLLVTAQSQDSGLIPSRSYPHNETLSPTPGEFVLYWDPGDNDITFEIHARTRGWVGLGISRSGGMTDADIAIGWVNEDGIPVLQDRSSRTQGRPVLDIHQDLKLISGRRVGNYTILVFSRLLETCDVDDIKIERMNTKLIWALGKFEMEVGAEPEKHEHSSKGTKTVTLLAAVRSNHHELPEGVQSMDIKLNNLEVPQNLTTWGCAFRRIPNIERKRHVIKMEPLIQPGNDDLVYLILVEFARARKGSVMRDWSGECKKAPFGRMHGSMIFVFARGGKEIYLPDEAGMPVGGPDHHAQEFDFISIRVPYENWDHDVGRTDSSGVRLYWTENLRKYDTGIFNVGATSWRSYIPPGSPEFFNYGLCSKDCMYQALKNDPEITLFAGLLHTHMAGSSVVVRHLRGGKELPPIAREKYHDKWYGEYRMLPEPVKIMRGDEVVIQCGYNTAAKEELVLGGWMKHGELCQAFFMYYPVNSMIYCEAAPTAAQHLQFLNLDVGYNGRVISSGIYYGKTAKEVLELQDWTNKTIRDRYQQSISQGEYTAQCEGSDKDAGVKAYCPNGNTVQLKLPEKTEIELMPCFSVLLNSTASLPSPGALKTISMLIILYHMNP